ncbi:MAG: hypothetical protein ACYTFI_26970, partial [Planctomycetota bacterium]
DLGILERRNLEEIVKRDSWLFQQAPTLDLSGRWAVSGQQVSGLPARESCHVIGGPKGAAHAACQEEKH